MQEVPQKTDAIQNCDLYAAKRLIETGGIFANAGINDVGCDEDVVLEILRSHFTDGNIYVVARDTFCLHFIGGDDLIVSEQRYFQIAHRAGLSVGGIVRGKWQNAFAQPTLRNLVGNGNNQDGQTARALAFKMLFDQGDSGFRGEWNRAHNGTKTGKQRRHALIFFGFHDQQSADRFGKQVVGRNGAGLHIRQQLQGGLIDGRRASDKISFRQQGGVAISQGRRQKGGRRIAGKTVVQHKAGDVGFVMGAPGVGIGFADFGIGLANVYRRLMRFCQSAGQKQTRQCAIGKIATDEFDTGAYRVVGYKGSFASGCDGSLKSALEDGVRGRHSASLVRA
jgi:hypothetical protein